MGFPFDINVNVKGVVLMDVVFFVLVARGFLDGFHVRGGFWRGGNMNMYMYKYLYTHAY